MKVALTLMVLLVALNLEGTQSIGLNPMIFLDLWKNPEKFEDLKPKWLEAVDCFDFPPWSMKWYQYGCNKVQPRMARTWRQFRTY